MALNLSRYTDRVRRFRNEINPSNYGALTGAIFAAAVGFLVGQAIFNRTVIRWLVSQTPPTDPAFIKAHQAALLGWLLLAMLCVTVSLVGSLWIAYQAFRFVWHRRAKG